MVIGYTPKSRYMSKKRFHTEEVGQMGDCETAVAIPVRVPPGSLSVILERYGGHDDGGCGSIQCYIRWPSLFLSSTRAPICLKIGFHDWYADGPHRYCVLTP